MTLSGTVEAFFEQKRRGETNITYNPEDKNKRVPLVYFEGQA
ncbi:hypothetical protein ACE41H_03100 [Paenibacillus enshidis]|uniref:Uncharacterized protein n=1 Tax=Paenibacillus enshidis TaxID=1458439 RepID=A0ABV5APJ4_9BACL